MKIIKSRCDMKRFYLISLILLILFMSACDISPAKPDADDESRNIPWQLISGKIAYSRYEGSPSTSYLFIIDGNSKKVNLIKKIDGVAQFSYLAWKLDGDTLTFSSFIDNEGHWQLFNISPDGGNLMNIYPANAHCKHPAWSTNGKLAYWYHDLEGYEIRVDGKTFLNALANYSRPAWSPDCKSLVISMWDANSQGSLYKVALSDKAVTPLLTAKGAENEEIYWDPIYSPDGNKIAFSKSGSSIGDKQEIWMMNSDGSNPERLTSGMGDSFPSWSPDGQYIAFCRDSDVGSSIFIIGLNDRLITRVTENKAQCLAWIK
jgi:Tol biopolymer transport system component